MGGNGLYHIWLQLALGFSHQYTGDILRNYGSVDEFYQAGEREWRLCGLFSTQQLEKLLSVPLTKAESIWARCRREGIRVAAFGDPGYPARLKNIQDPPPVIYWKGAEMSIDREVCIAMVGTRHTSAYGADIASRLGYGLARSGAVVVSGGAVGIDTAAHMGALAAQGRTIAVLGCGICYPYLKKNQTMREKICERGALVSEYPPDEPPVPYYFPVRNRIISGLSLGTVVVEAGQKSGSLITATRALEQGRDLFSVPGSILSPTSNGTKHLIQNGAKPVTNIKDILEEYCQIYPDKLLLKNTEIPMEDIAVPSQRKSREEFFPRRPLSNLFEEEPMPQIKGRVPQKDGAYPTAEKKTAAPHEVEPFSEPLDRGLPELSEAAGRLFNLLKEEPQQIDDLAVQAGLSISELLGAATELELEGLMEAKPGKRYCRK